LNAGESRAEDATILLPLGRARQTVEVLVRGSADGFPVTRGTVLNVVFDTEPAREVILPGGVRLREVPATRLGS
jgi:hypothetical protein